MRDNEETMRVINLNGREIYLRGLFTLMMLAAALVQAQAAEQSARVWEAPLVIPTYELGPPNHYPTLLDWDRRKWRPVYPYPLLDTLTTNRRDKSYRAVYLENEFLRVTVLPELGGRLYAIYDKTAQRDILYTNHVVKYAMVGIRGAWISGGVEWNFPDGHTLTTVSPIDYTIRMENDGSAAVVVGDTERVQGMEWSIAIRLRPGSKAVEADVTLNNRQSVPGRYWYWSTAAAPATNDMRFVYPMREAYPHTFWPVYSFPKEKGVDISTYREVVNDLSLFARNSQRDFFGIYYEQADWGVVHVADHRELPGKKTWTWGTDESGKIWIDKLTETDGQYVEFQAGRFETQMEHEFIAPHRVERFTEFWYPVNGLGGGFDEATRDAALRVRVENNQAAITINANSRQSDAELTLRADENVIRKERVNLDPSRTYKINVELPVSAKNKPLAITLQSKDGRKLLQYRTDQPVDGNPDFHPATRPPQEPKRLTSAEQAYVEGLAADKKSDERAARAAYQEALNRDQNFSPALTALGLSHYRSGEYAVAAKHLEKALGRNKDAGDAHYYLALTYRARGLSSAALDQLRWCIRRGYRESLAHFVSGEIALADNRQSEAREHFQEAVTLDPRDVNARTMLALTERLLGQTELASEQLANVVAEMPLDYLALQETALTQRSVRGAEAKARGAQGELARILDREPDSVLELAFTYLRLNLKSEAKAILEEAIDRQKGRNESSAFPLWHYTLGYIEGLNGHDERARAQFRLGSQLDSTLVFPHRLDEIPVMQAALKANPQDGKAAYYLGNIFAAHNRGEEALQSWQKAVSLDPEDIIARRNYARALWVVSGRKQEAFNVYQQAIAARPDEYRLYIEADKLLAEMKDNSRRLALLEKAPPSVRAHSAFVQSLAEVYAANGRDEEAARLLDNTNFTSGEGEFLVLALYRQIHRSLGRKFARAGNHLEAAKEFLRATEYPKNFGAGAPSMQSQARELVAAAKSFTSAGKIQEAEHLWQRAAGDPLNSPTQPTEPWSEHYYYKALALAHVGRQAEAQALYQRLATLGDDEKMYEAEPSPPEGAIRFVLAGAGLKALGRIPEARLALNRALQLDAGNELARSQLAEITGAPAGARRQVSSSGNN